MKIVGVETFFYCEGIIAGSKVGEGTHEWRRLVVEFVVGRGAEWVKEWMGVALGVG